MAADNSAAREFTLRATGWARRGNGPPSREYIVYKGILGALGGLGGGDIYYMFDARCNSPWNYASGYVAGLRGVSEFTGAGA